MGATRNIHSERVSKSDTQERIHKNIYRAMHHIVTRIMESYEHLVKCMHRVRDDLESHYKFNARKKQTQPWFFDENEHLSTKWTLFLIKFLADSNFIWIHQIYWMFFFSHLLHNWAFLANEIYYDSCSTMWFWTFSNVDTCFKWPLIYRCCEHYLVLVQMHQARN